MKYYIESKATGNVIVSTDDLDKAFDLAEAYEENHFDDAVITDEQGHDVADWYDFIYEIIQNSDSGCMKMDEEDARLTLTEWAVDGVEIPAGLTAETLQFIWNQAIVDLDRMIEDCIRENDAAEYTAECREASDVPYEPAVRENAGYEIVQALRIDSKHEIVIGRHPTAPARYVVWDCKNGNDYDNGAYTYNYRQALHAMAERIMHRYDFLPVEF